MHHGLRQNGCRGGAVSGNIVCLGCNFLGQLRAHVFIGVFEFNLACNGHAIVGDCGSSPLFVNHNIATLGAECDANGIGESVNAALKAAAGLLIKF